MRFYIEKSLKRKLTKLHKKDKVMYEAVMRKIQEIIQNPHHYKPLRRDLKNIRRVHIKKSFVLVFTLYEDEDLVKFLDLDHHDVIYKKRFSI